ncbi:MAG: hypothetical protein RIQ60_2294 [Pseudomonadota bacterium]|jgi:coenzyme F420 hydrogenase subunit beta
MRFSAAGHLRPDVAGKLSDTEASIFSNVCPGKSITQPEIVQGQEKHPIWGPILTCHAGFSSDTQLRRQGSSGGVISALAAHLLDTEQVDFILQTAADPSDPIGNKVQASISHADIGYAAGSRYAPSAPLETLNEYLATGKRFAVVGKPCDIAALRALARHDQRISRQVPVMLSFMCAGMPSRAGTVELLRQMGVQKESLKTFRYRGDGWPGKAKAVTHDGKVHEKDYNSSWGLVLNRYLQFRCKVCPDGTGEFADIVCADAWYGIDGYPDFSERDGRSLVLCRTSVGMDLLASATKSGAVELSELPISEIAKMQPYQVARKQLVLARLGGAALALGSIPKYRNLGLWQAARNARPLDLLTNLLGTFKRARRDAK